MMTTIQQFINKVCTDVKCYPQFRETDKIGLKKNDTDDKQQMKLFAVVSEQQYRFKIKIKEKLINEECKIYRPRELWDHGTPTGRVKEYGVIFFVTKDNTYSGYPILMACLKMAGENA